MSKNILYFHHMKLNPNRRNKHQISQLLKSQTFKTQKVKGISELMKASKMTLWFSHHDRSGQAWKNKNTLDPVLPNKPTVLQSRHKVPSNHLLSAASFRGTTADHLPPPLPAPSVTPVLCISSFSTSMDLLRTSSVPPWLLLSRPLGLKRFEFFCCNHSGAAERMGMAHYVQLCLLIVEFSKGNTVLVSTVCPPWSESVGVNLKLSNGGGVTAVRQQQLSLSVEPIQNLQFSSWVMAEDPSDMCVRCWATHELRSDSWGVPQRSVLGPVWFRLTRDNI